MAISLKEIQTDFLHMAPDDIIPEWIEPGGIFTLLPDCHTVSIGDQLLPQLNTGPDNSVYFKYSQHVELASY